MCFGWQKNLELSPQTFIFVVSEGDNDPASETGAAGITEGMHIHFCIIKKNM
jgi:hypothetical protein